MLEPNTQVWVVRDSYDNFYSEPLCTTIKKRAKNGKYVVNSVDRFYSEGELFLSKDTARWALEYYGK